MIPGTIPGLLRRGSPVVVGIGRLAERGVYLGPCAHGAKTYGGEPLHAVSVLDGEDWADDAAPLSIIFLDLADRTGHAGWWLGEHIEAAKLEAGDWDVYMRTNLRFPLTTEQQAHLAALVCRIAGVSP